MLIPIVIDRKSLDTGFHIIAPIYRHLIVKNAANECTDEDEMSETLVHDAYSGLYDLEHRLTSGHIEVNIKAIVMSFPEDLIREIKHANPVIAIIAGKMDTAAVDAL